MCAGLRLCVEGFYFIPHSCICPVLHKKVTYDTFNYGRMLILLLHFTYTYKWFATGEANRMQNWFYNPTISFHMWDLTHVITVGIALIFIFILFAYRSALLPYRKTIRIATGCTLIASRISLDIWYITTGEWSFQSSLPLELCSIASLICGVMLLINSRFLCEIFYFIAIGGAIQAMITPALDFGFPQFRYIQFFLDHFLLMMAPLILIWYYHYKLTWKSVFKAFITINIIAVIVYCLNVLFSSNYMFLMYKPKTASLLDLLGPYPFYLLSLEVIVWCIFVLLFFPFLFMRK